MRHIAIVYEQELDIGGVETHLLCLFRRLDPQQYRFTVLAPASASYRAEANRLGVQTIPIEPYKPLSLRALHRMRQVFRQEKIDLVHAHSPTAAVPARLAAKALGLPTVVTIHAPAIGYHGVLNTLRASSGRRLYVFIDRILNHALTDRLIFVSDRVYAQSIQHGWAPASRSVVIHNGIDLSQFQEQNRQLGEREAVRESMRHESNLAPDLPVILYIGRLSDLKGLDVLLESLAQLTQRSTQPFAAWIIGAGPLEAELKAQASHYSLNERVRFIGPRQDIPACLAAGDVFVLPSRLEAMSISLIEAMASGLPCLVTDVGDNSCLVEHGVEGFVIPPGNPGALSESLIKLLEDPPLRRQMGEKAHQKSLNYSDLEMARQVQAVYDEVLL